MTATPWAATNCSADCKSNENLRQPRHRHDSRRGLRRRQPRRVGDGCSATATPTRGAANNVKTSASVRSATTATRDAGDTAARLQVERELRQPHHRRRQGRGLRRRQHHRPATAAAPTANRRSLRQHNHRRCGRREVRRRNHVDGDGAAPTATRRDVRKPRDRHHQGRELDDGNHVDATGAARTASRTRRACNLVTRFGQGRGLAMTQQHRRPTLQRDCKSGERAAATGW